MQLERVAAVTDCITLCAVADVCVCVFVCVSHLTHPHSSHCSDRKEVVTKSISNLSVSFPGH